MPQTKYDRYVDMAEVAHILQCSRQHARNLAARGAFGEPVDYAAPGAQRRRLRVRLGAVEAWREAASYSEPGEAS